MNTKQLTDFLEEHKADIHKAIKDKIISDLTARVGWELPDLLKKEVDAFYATEISPAVRDYLSENKNSILEACIKACVEASEAVAKAMVAQVMKTMSDEYKSREVFKKLFNTF